MLKFLAQDNRIERRQLGVVDCDGNTSATTGSYNNPWAGHISSLDHVAMGNGLVGKQVVQSMAQTFEDAQSENLEERLLARFQRPRVLGIPTV